MNRIKYWFVFVFLIGLSSNLAFAQVSDVTTNLKNLFEFSKAKSFEKAAELIAYDGEDKARIQMESFNAANKDEIAQVKRICKKISALIELSSKYDFSTPVVKQDGDKEIQTIDVSFVSGDQKLVTEFSFIKTEKGLLLFNMN
ncbi:MAG: hypothetical protein FD143_1539 [Ignavibacteria bacterium]|nr:MAG: hypothetical protein FD143_1539 [Ignavibacteria bacterium]KAF0161863.1 MAG: hypothetical protein FD188_457 [Ignavibacteria bacterium]